jgi:outer membrane lipoprotein carrier protein
MLTRVLALLLSLAGDKAGTAAPAPAAPAKTAPAAAAAAPSPGRPGATAQPALPLPQVIERMQKRYEGASDFRARFSQRYTFAATGRERLSTGEVLIKKPGRMRWNYENPEPQMYLASGQHFWLYQPEDKQAYKQDLKSSQLPAAVSFLMGKGKLSDEFEITLAKELPYGTASDYRLSLKPKQPQATYKAIYFVVDPESFFVRQSVLINAQGDVNAITFSGIKTDTKIPDSTFKWAPPAGVRVLDGAKLGR